MPSQTGNPPNGNPVWSNLSSQQIDGRAFQEDTDTYRVDITAIDPSVVLPVVQGGLTVLGSFLVPFSSLSTGSPFIVTAATIGTTQQVYVSDTTGQTYKMTLGSQFIYTNPGCERVYSAQVAPGSSITLQSMDATPVAGNFIITILGTP